MARAKKRVNTRAEQRKQATEIIAMLKSRGFLVQCPNVECEETVSMKDCGLFFGDEFTDKAAELYEALVEAQGERLNSLQETRKHISASSEIVAQAVNAGRIWERLIPCMSSFCFDSGDCRSLFDPIDYIVFEGLHSESISRILFLEIKTGRSRLTKPQKEIRSLVESKKVAMRVARPVGA